jgi:hypothetical protein
MRKLNNKKGRYKMYKYIVWVGGSEIGQYKTKKEADEVAFEWAVVNGYDDTIVEAIDTNK